MATAKKDQKPDEVNDIAKPDVASYVVLSRLDHDGKSYATGEPIQLDSATAEPLEALKVIEPAKD